VAVARSQVDGPSPNRPMQQLPAGGDTVTGRLMVTVTSHSDSDHNDWHASQRETVTVTMTVT
jgi:hypothetical protein